MAAFIFTATFLVVGAVLVAALFVYAFFAPRRSRRTQAEVDERLEGGKDAAAAAPRPVDDLLEKPLDASENAADTAAEAGRKSRFRISS